MIDMKYKLPRINIVSSSSAVFGDCNLIVDCVLSSIDGSKDDDKKNVEKKTLEKTAIGWHEFDSSNWSYENKGELHANYEIETSHFVALTSFHFDKRPKLC